MLSKNIETALNKQVHIEAESSQIYLSMASWSETHGLEEISKFMLNRMKNVSICLR
jgi:ferritin